MKNFKKIVALACLSLLNLQSAKAFTVLGNGIDGVFAFSEMKNNQAWFVGSRNATLTACVQKYPKNVKVSQATFETIVQEAFTYWKARTPTFSFSLFAHPSQIKFEGGCIGSEDLRFEIVGNEETKEWDPTFSLVRFSNIRAAEAIVYNPSQSGSWHKGKISIVGPDRELAVQLLDSERYEVKMLDWNDENKIAALLYHEIGHVFGHNHKNDGEIMDAKAISQYLFFFQNAKQ